MPTPVEDLKLQIAEELKIEIQRRLTMPPIDFAEWLSAHMYEQAARIARATREHEQAKRPKRVAKLSNGNRNTCTCVHCAPFLDARHGGGCSGYHCSGSCML